MWRDPSELKLAASTNWPSMSELLGSGSSSPARAASRGGEVSFPDRALPTFLICGQGGGCCCCEALNLVLFWVLVMVGGLHRKSNWDRNSGISIKTLDSRTAPTLTSFQQRSLVLTDLQVSQSSSAPRLLICGPGLRGHTP